MEIRPLAHYKVPKYPRGSEVKQEQSCINKICHQWIYKLMKKSLAVTAVMMALSGCIKAGQQSIYFQNQTGKVETYILAETSSETASELYIKRRGVKADVLFLTPMVLPQPFGLTEEAAWEIIEQKAKEVGLNLQKETKKVRVFGTGNKEYIEKIKNFAPKRDIWQIQGVMSFKLDGYDFEKKVGIEYIGLGFYPGKHFLNAEELISIYDIADTVNEALEKKIPDEHIKILKMDSVTHPGEWQTVEKAEQALERELDKFFNELKAKGIID